MIIFTDNIISVSEDLEGKDTSAPVTSTPEELEGKDTSAPVTSTPEELEVKDTSVSSQQSAQGETMQTVVPSIVNDIVVPDNSYSKYCFFFLMLLFALFVGRSFRKGV